MILEIESIDMFVVDESTLVGDVIVDFKLKYGKLAYLIPNTKP